MKIILTPQDVEKIIEGWAKRVGYDVANGGVKPQEDGSYSVVTNSIELAKKLVTQKKYPTQED